MNAERSISIESIRVMFDYPRRIETLRDSMLQRGVDLAVFSVGADMLFLAGYEAPASERLTALVVTMDKEPVLVVPELEAPRVPGDVQVVTWSETEDPVDVLARIGGSPGHVAVGDHMWSTFLIQLQRKWGDAAWMPASELTRDLRMRKDPTEIEALRRAARAVDRVMERVPVEVRFSGRSEAEVARELAEMTIDEGHDTSEFTIVASGPNSSSPHHDPGDRIIEEGDLVVCDFGGRWDGYCSDSTRTFSVGEPSVGQVEVHDAVLEANTAGRDAVAPGVRCEDVDRTARAVIEEAGYGEFFIHRTGHGIGLEVHEHPYIVEGNELRLEAGMTFSIEPGIYVPGKVGVRIEDIVACTDDGVHALNHSERALTTVG